MKLLLENWREFVTESNKKMGTIDGEVDLWTGNLYVPKEFGKWITIGKEGENLEVEIISGWQDQGVESTLIRVVGLEYDDGDTVEGWVEAAAVDIDLDEVINKSSSPCSKPRIGKGKGKPPYPDPCFKFPGE